MTSDRIPLDYNFGKVPPQAVEVEEAVLASFLLESDAIIENHLDPKWFYKHEHQLIAKEILHLNSLGKRIDLLTVVQSLKDNKIIDEIGGALAIAQLVRRVASAANIAQHLRIIQDKYLRREAIAVCNQVIQMSYDESNDVEDVIGKLHSSTLGVMEYNKSTVKDFRYALSTLLERMYLNQNSGALTGIPTGFMQLDRFTGGWQGSDLVIVAGETSQGKTSLVLNFSLHASLQNVPGVIYSLEMSLLQMTARFVSSYVKISSKRLLFEKLNSYDFTEVEEGIKKLDYLPIYTDDNVSNSIESICLSIRRMHLKYGVKYAVVDYIQNVKEISGKNEESSLGVIVKMLKNLAKELDITIFAVSQLRRNPDKPYPSISRLRGSGQIEETADIILTVYRPEYYKLPFPEPFEEEFTEGRAMINVAKGRNIGTGTFLTNFDKSTTTFSDIEHEEN